MRNKTTKKYKHNKIKTRKIRGGGGGGGFLDGITGFFQSTTDTNREISQITELQNKLAQNMQDLTSTYKNVYKKVTNLNNKIQNLSNISNTNQQNETLNENNNGFFNNIGNMIGYQKNNSPGQQSRESNESVDNSRQNMSESGGPPESYGSVNNIQQSRESNESGEPLESYGSENNSRENMSEFGTGNNSQQNMSGFESGNNESGEERPNEGNQGFDGGKRKSRRKHRARKR
jgi:hypothetical protein